MYQLYTSEQKKNNSAWLVVKKKKKRDKLSQFEMKSFYYKNKNMFW